MLKPPSQSVTRTHFCRSLQTRLIVLIGALVPLLCSTLTAGGGVVEGTIYDASTGLAIPFATIQQVSNSRATLANAEGRYRLIMGDLPATLKFSHIAYYSELMDISSIDSALTLDVHLKSNLVDLGTMQVYSRRLDPGQQIIFEAIRRKRDILTHIHDYRYDAYVKMVVDDQSDSDSSKIFLITETQMTAFWEQPDQYKEIINSRRQSANLKADNNLVTVGRILNFNLNRIELGPYSIVSPTAEDALDHYNYYLLDTTFIDSLPVFRLEIEPKNPTEPLFEGFIHIAAETYDVVSVEVGFSDGVDIPFLINPTYSQRFARLENEYWMPIEIRFEAGVELKIPLPGVPKKMNLAHTASLYSYEFDQGLPHYTFDEFVVEVNEAADDFDSTAWFATQTIPLTETEKDAYVRIDSLESLPPSVGEIARNVVGGVLYLTLGGNDDFFRFNRVDGAYLGVALQPYLIPGKLWLRLKTGYAFGAKHSQHQIGFTHRLHQRRRLEIGFDYQTRITRRSTIMPGPEYSPTLTALWDGYDPLDYYRDKGWQAFVTTKLLKQTSLKFTYSDLKHNSETVTEDFTLFGDDNLPPRLNPFIANGELRSLTAEFNYDSRKMLKNKKREMRLNEGVHTTLTAGVEHSGPDVLNSDFDFDRYYVEFYRRQRSLGFGVTELLMYAGGSDGSLPPQKYFSISFADVVRIGSPAFYTLGRSQFGGNHALAIYAAHNFRGRLLKASGLPLFKEIPFWVNVHGGLFWTEFRNQPPAAGNDHILSTGSPYREIGFGLSNLTPFLFPFNFAINFTWQLSDYDTDDFTIFFGFDM